MAITGLLQPPFFSTPKKKIKKILFRAFFFSGLVDCIWAKLGSVVCIQFELGPMESAVPPEWRGWGLRWCYVHANGTGAVKCVTHIYTVTRTLFLGPLCWVPFICTLAIRSSVVLLVTAIFWSVVLDFQPHWSWMFMDCHSVPSLVSHTFDLVPGTYRLWRRGACLFCGVWSHQIHRWKKCSLFFFLPCGYHSNLTAMAVILGHAWWSRLCYCRQCSLLRYT